LPQNSRRARFQNEHLGLCCFEGNPLARCYTAFLLEASEGAKTGKNIASVSIIDLNAKQSIL